MEKVKSKKPSLKEALEKEVRGPAVMVRLLWLSELTGLDPTTLISSLKENAFRNEYEVVHERGVNWVRRKLERTPFPPKNETYVVYVNHPKNKARIHRITCPEYRGRKAIETDRGYWSDKYPHGLFESFDDAENFAKGTRKILVDTCAKCLPKKYQY